MMDLEKAIALTTSESGYHAVTVENVEIFAYHGEDDKGGEPVWFTTDKAHAAYFGRVEEYDLKICKAIVLDAKRDPRLASECGPEADAELFRILGESESVAAIVIGWEGRGLTILYP